MVNPILVDLFSRRINKLLNRLGGNGGQKLKWVGPITWKQVMVKGKEPP